MTVPRGEIVDAVLKLRKQHPVSMDEAALIVTASLIENRLGEIDASLQEISAKLADLSEATWHNKA